MDIKALEFPQSCRWLLSFDFDDTLYDASSFDKVPSVFFDMLREVRQEYGVVWGINTGRSLDYFIDGYLAEASAPFAPDFVVTRERDVYLRNENGELCPCYEWNQACSLAHRELFECYSGALTELFQSLKEAFADVDWWVQPGEPYSLEVRYPGDLDRFEPIVKPFLKLHPGLSVQRAGPYLRFCHAAYNKGTALARIVENWHVKAHHVWIFGDSYNDLDAMAYNPQAICCCPKNAVAPVQELVVTRHGYVSQYEKNQGVVDLLEHVVIPALRRG